jgi:hypothetical protein
LNLSIQGFKTEQCLSNLIYGGAALSRSWQPEHAKIGPNLGLRLSRIWAISLLSGRGSGLLSSIKLSSKSYQENNLNKNAIPDLQGYSNNLGHKINYKQVLNMAYPDMDYPDYERITIVKES